jgi:dipeptide/tripeptide permease
MIDNINNKSKLFTSWSFGKVNYMLFGIGIITIILGYILMTTGETTSFQSVKLSPIVLVIGYCIIIPASILVKSKK